MGLQPSQQNITKIAATAPSSVTIDPKRSRYFCPDYGVILGTRGQWAMTSTPKQIKCTITIFFDNPMANIVDIAVNTDGFSTLVAAVKAANLVEALTSPGPFTVFAPNDTAFAKLPPGTVQTLVQNPPQLARILSYHVVAGKLTSADLKQVDSVESLEGSPISINWGDNPEVKNSTVIAADIEADNGIIHVIDNVILMG